MKYLDPKEFDSEEVNGRWQNNRMAPSEYEKNYKKGLETPNWPSLKVKIVKRGQKGSFAVKD